MPTAAPEDGVRQRPAPIDPGREYVAGGSPSTGVQALRTAALGLAIDDVERDFGTTTYEKMMRDPAVYGSVETLKSLTLAESIRVVGAINDAEDPDFERSELLRQFVADNLEQCATPIAMVLHEMLDAIWRGSYIAEKVLETKRWNGRVYYMLSDLKPKHPSKTAYIVDPYMNVLGIGLRDVAPDGSTSGLPTIDGVHVVDRSRFFVLRFWTVGGDPRGLSILRPAYNAWYLRQQTWPAYLQYLIQFANPAIIGTTPEDATNDPVLDDEGGVELGSDGSPKTKTPEEAMVDALLAFQGGTVTALRGGSTVTLIESKGDGAAFREALELFKREIVLSILRVTRATMESQHGSKADAEVAQDVLGVFVRWIRTIVEALFQRDVVDWLVKLNFGEDWMPLRPKCLLSSEAQEDLAALRESIGKLFAAGFIDESQVPELDVAMKLPKRDVGAWLARRAEKADVERMNVAELAKLRRPGAEEDNVGD